MTEHTWKKQLLEIKEEKTCFLLGVTGGIATGKSTVAAMLAEKGAVLIDFDELAREAVIPGRPAYEEIIAFFGQEVLKEDKTLDRKKLAGLVFQDLEKRKKLEDMIHPRVNRLHVECVQRVIQKNPHAIIASVIPLMIESNMQIFFHKLLLVYAPVEAQVRRLMTRDLINRSEAVRIIQNQMPIDAKQPYADFTIRNGGPLTETQKQVDALWPRFEEWQKINSR